MTRRRVLAFVCALSLLAVSRMYWPASIDREGYWRNPTLLDIFSPPVEGAYRASVIKSIQYTSQTIAGGATSATSTITAVLTANSVLHFLGQKSDALVAALDVGDTNVKLTNTTTVTFARHTNTSATIASAMVVEYYSNILKSNQDFAVSIVSTTTGTATISAVVIAKTSIVWRGWDYDTGGAANMNTGQGYLTGLSNTTTVGATGTAGAGTLIVYGTAAEYR